MQTWARMMLAAWVLLSQVSYEHCTAEPCRPGHQVQQRLQVRPTLEACESLKQQMERATVQSPGRRLPAVEVGSATNALRQYVTFRCEEER